MGNSIIQDNGTNIGIGISPSYKLDVSGTTGFRDNTTYINASSASIGWGGNTTSAAPFPVIYSDNNFLALNSKAGSRLYFNYDNTNASSYVDFFAGKVTIDKNGAGIFASSITASTALLTGSSAVTVSVNATDTTSYSAFYHSESGTAKAYWEYINSTYATTARRNYLEAYNIVGGFSVYTANTKALDINTSQVATFSSDVTLGVGAAATNVQLKINGYLNKAGRIIFQESGVDKWLVGNGAASENGNFEIYNANGQMALSFVKATSVANMGSNLFNQNYGRLNILSVGNQLYNGVTVYSNDGTDSFIGLGSNGTVSGVNLTYGSTGSYLPFVAIVGGSERIRIGTDGAMAFNTSITGVRSYLFKALSGRQLAIEALESGGVHAIYLRPSSSGRNLIASNYFSGGVYLPLALSGRENDTDFVLQTNGNVSVGSSSDAGTKFQVNGANYVEMATFVATSASAAAIVSANAGYVQFANGEARHLSNSGVFTATTDGVQILKPGIVHITVSQDIITNGTTSYAALYIRKNGTNISENLITNTNGQWDGINGVATTSVNANDVIGFYYSADITAFDPGTWSQYSFIWSSR